jgi:hypothetical protein
LNYCLYLDQWEHNLNVSNQFQSLRRLPSNFVVYLIKNIAQTPCTLGNHAINVNIDRNGISEPILFMCYISWLWCCCQCVCCVCWWLVAFVDLFGGNGGVPKTVVVVGVVVVGGVVAIVVVAAVAAGVVGAVTARIFVVICIFCGVKTGGATPRGCAAGGVVCECLKS